MKKKHSKTFGEVMGEKMEELFSDPIRRAAYLRMGAETMKLDPPSTRDHRDRDAGWPDPDKCAVRAGRWAAAHPFLYDEAVAPIVKDALETGDATEVFASLSKGADSADSPPPRTSFYRHVTSAMKVAAQIMDTQNRMPTKKEVREGVAILFDEKGWGDAEEGKTRWTEFFTAATLGDLPTR